MINLEGLFSVRYKLKMSQFRYEKTISIPLFGFVLTYIKKIPTDLRTRFSRKFLLEFDVRFYLVAILFIIFDLIEADYLKLS